MNRFSFFLSRHSTIAIFIGACFPLLATPIDPEIPYQVGEVIFEDDFKSLSDLWLSELEDGGTVAAKEGALVIDVPAGATVWLKKPLEGPLRIEYQATVVVRDGKNDRLSDLNVFWMARDSRSPGDLFESHRSGKFSDYNLLQTYYVGQGGNSNTTTRFRRYIGDKELRPLLQEHDLRDAAHLLVANTEQKIELIAAGSHILYRRDGKVVFRFNDAAPYTRGWFGFRTVSSHLEIRNLRIHRLIPSPPAP